MTSGVQPAGQPGEREAIRAATQFWGDVVKVRGAVEMAYPIIAAAVRADERVKTLTEAADAIRLERDLVSTVQDSNTHWLGVRVGLGRAAGIVRGLGRSQ